MLKPLLTYLLAQGRGLGLGLGLDLELGLGPGLELYVKNLVTPPRAHQDADRQQRHKRGMGVDEYHRHTWAESHEDGTT